MDLKKLALAATPGKLGAYLAGRKDHMAKSHAAMGSAASMREAEHDGHRIVIRTTYNIQVDGKPIKARLGVDASGRVHCHALPNYQTSSAIDMVKALIENFPEDFAPAPPRAKAPAKRSAKSPLKPPAKKSSKSSVKSSAKPSRHKH